MKKLNLILKVVVLAVFAGGLGLAGNGLNCEVSAMDNFGCSAQCSFGTEYFEKLTKYLEKLFYYLKKGLNYSNFSEEYEKLQNGVMFDTLSPNSKKTAITRCGDTLRVIERFKSDLDYIKNGPLGDLKSEEIKVIEGYLQNIHSAFSGLYRDLSKKDWVPSKNNTSEIADNVAKFELEYLADKNINEIVEPEVPADKKISEIAGDMVSKVKLNDENDRKINELVSSIRYFKSKFKISSDSKIVISSDVQQFLDLLNSVYDKLKIVYEMRLDNHQRLKFNVIERDFFDMIDNVDIERLDSEQKSVYWAIRNDIKKMVDSSDFYSSDPYERKFFEQIKQQDMFSGMKDGDFKKAYEIIYSSLGAGSNKDAVINNSGDLLYKSMR